jgi:hypothetical protein
MIDQKQTEETINEFAFMIKVCRSILSKIGPYDQITLELQEDNMFIKF